MWCLFHKWRYDHGLARTCMKCGEHQTDEYRGMLTGWDWRKCGCDYYTEYIEKTKKEEKEEEEKRTDRQKRCKYHNH